MDSDWGDESRGPIEGGRRVSPDESTGYTEQGTVQLTDLSVRAIGLYQRQAELTDRLWSYFGTNSAFAILAALAAPVLAGGGWFRWESSHAYVRVLLGLAVLAYYGFSAGNRQALRVSQEALERIATQAQAASGIELEVIKPAKALLFHRLVSFLTLALMITGFVIADRIFQELMRAGSRPAL